MITRDILAIEIDVFLYNNKLNMDKFLDFIEASNNTNGYIIQYLNDTVLIYSTYTDKYISWYKLTHIGRSLNTNIESLEELKIFLSELFEEVE